METENHHKRSARITLKEKEKKEQKSKAIQAKYRPLHPEIFGLEDSFLADSFVSAMASKDPEKIKFILKKEHDGIYSFDLLKPNFCAKLIEESEHYEKSGLPIRRPNSMNNYGM
jgi:hypothetical protein